MKVMVFVKATPNSEKGLMPNDETLKQMFTDMGKYNEELVKAGIMQMGDGLKPSSHGKRIKFTDGNVSVIDGPFAESKELVAGFWIWEVKSLDEAIDWARRCPNPMPGEEGVLEIRPFYEMEDFGDAVTDEHLERNARLRKQIERQQKPQAKAKSAVKGKKAPVRAKARVKAKSKAAKGKPSRARAKPAKSKK